MPVTLLLALLVGAASAQELVAAFSAEIVSGPAPMHVQFTDRSAGPVLTRAWDFDADGQTDSTAAEPLWSYSGDGDFPVTLTVTSAGTDDRVTRELFARHAGPTLIWVEEEPAFSTLGAVHTDIGGDGESESVVADIDMLLQRPALAATDRWLFVGWAESRAGRSVIYLRASDDHARSWDVLQRLASTDAVVGKPALAADGDSVYVAWRRVGSAASVVRMRVSRDAGQSWADTIDVPGADPAGNPRLAVRGLRVVAAWRETDTDGDVFRVVRSDDGGMTWTTPATVPASLNATGDPAVAIAGDGIALVYTRTLAGRAQIWTSHSPDAGQSWASQPLTRNQGESVEPALARSGDRLQAAWIDRLAEEGRIHLAQSADGGASWTEPWQLVSTPAALEDLFLAAQGDRLDVLWSDRRSGEREVFMKTSDDGGASWSFSRLTHTAAPSRWPLRHIGVASLAPSVTFRDDTLAQGLSYVGETFGASWGDADDDGWPDLYVSNHRDTHALFLNRNEAGSGFEPVDTAAWPDSGDADTHGGVWMDLDADGDKDLFVQVGAERGVGEGPNLALINEDGSYIDRAVTLNLDQPLGRGRTPGVGDFDGDGRLDLILNTLKRSDGLGQPTIMLAGDTGYVDARDMLGLDVPAARFSKLADITGDGRPDLLFAGSGLRAYDTGSIPLVDITDTVGLADITVPTDVAIADFDGDGRADLYIARLPYFTDEVVRLNGDQVGVYLSPGDPDADRGLRFRAAGDVTFTFGPRVFIDLIEAGEQVIFVGAAGEDPGATVFTLSASDPASAGILPHEGSSEHAVYIGYDAATDEWALYRYGPAPASAKVMRVFIEAAAGITDLQSQSLEPHTPSHLFLRGTVAGFTDVTEATGLGELAGCGSVAAADLDNDADVDLYVQCTNHLIDTPDRIFLNRGTGLFDQASLTEATDAVTPGRGDTVTAADFDRDGNLDLFLTHGENGTPGNTGPHRLLRNRGGGGHWLQIDLHGVVSNPQGIGAIVQVVAGGRSQIRYQDGGMHKYSQDHARLHFGLGAADVVDEIVVHWPGGLEQVLGPVTADQRIEIVEGVSIR